MPLAIACVSSALNPMATFTLSCFTPKTLAPILSPLKPSFTPLTSTSQSWALPPLHSVRGRKQTQPLVTRAAVDSDYSAKRSSSSDSRETIMLPGCDYNHWLIVMEFPKDPAPTREQMIDTYLNTLATVLGSMEEAKKNMYAFSTTTYTGFQCTVDEATSEKFKGLPGVLWVLPDSYIDVKNKDYGGDKYINGEIISCTYPTYQPKQRNSSKYESRRYERRRDGPPPERRRPRQGASTSESASG
ncbi:hypothetical protein P3X46_033369 [Hevea brasiliensis]|uniref:MORF/ORRM1/DAG-like MORF domain-containing protein n=1 Tax=Hevea brasiliensis TaxID=3981 RepID=A0ABQ9KJ43_HEVBR|nr:multiple organellar RNA editing factor 9, chloroplastic [Hevea brasiliensis]KAJ9136277.1 hypothetical protein P3X46_033369 [Hevea brasiliensis]